MSRRNGTEVLPNGPAIEPPGQAIGSSPQVRHTIRSGMSQRSVEHDNLKQSEPFRSRRKLLLFVLACGTLELVSCKRDSESHREMAAPVPQKVVAAEQKAPLGPCPDAPYPMLQAKDPATGHHRVFLRWDASTSGSGSDPKELGYCLYRTQKPGSAKDCPKNYPKCEQVNVVPVRGTRCVDELVKDSTTYYYVAIAITSADKSTTSEEAIAEVPAAGKRNPPPPVADSYRACRTAETSSQPNGR